MFAALLPVVAVLTISSLPATVEHLGTLDSTLTPGRAIRSHELPAGDASGPGAAFRRKPRGKDLELCLLMPLSDSSPIEEDACAAGREASSGSRPLRRRRSRRRTQRGGAVRFATVGRVPRGSGCRSRGVPTRMIPSHSGLVAGSETAKQPERRVILQSLQVSIQGTVPIDRTGVRVRYTVGEDLKPSQYGWIGIDGDGNGTIDETRCHLSRGTAPGPQDNPGA